MNPRIRQWGWPVAKTLLALAILFGVARQFERDLRRLDFATLEVDWAWMAVSSLLYLAGIGTSALFWLLLLHTFGERTAPLRALRAYYIGHLGKYVPGKAWALLLRGSLVAPEVRFGVAALTSFYEVLTTMATGALIAALVFAIDPPQVEGLTLPPAVTGLLLLGLVGVPLLPGVFNRIVGRMARRFPQVESLQLPKLRGRTLAEGMLLVGVGWVLLGLSLWAMLRAVLPEPPALTAGALAQYAGIIGLAYVAGFLAVFMPSGVGVREYVLLTLLAVPGDEANVALAVLLLRLAWTASELVLAALFGPWGLRRQK